MDGWIYSPVGFNKERDRSSFATHRTRKNQPTADLEKESMGGDKKRMPTIDEESEL